jgi:CRP-like cAMP-binding protein
MENLAAYFAPYGFNETELATIARSFEKKDFLKGDFFVQEGKTSRHLGFVETGVFQYFFNQDGEEITTYIVGENGFVASLVSFFKETPARENIRAMTDSTVWLLSKEKLATLQRNIPVFREFYIGLLEWQIGCIDDSRFDLLTLSAEERYQKMLGEEPHLLQQIPLQYLASILGVTPRHLSRIRKNIR